MLTEITVRSTGGPLAVEEFASTEQLVQAVLYEDPWHMYDSTRELDRVPERYRRALCAGFRTLPAPSLEGSMRLPAPILRTPQPGRACRR
ncbi:hypothetical protein ACIRRA_23975 [Nocardia sp. NPDC101769]|uniref:hypothetical protein n=1 Tax=Nocardia sp. NPDC101769 TaxID=3364333 RepID=UPI0037FB2CB1